MDLQPNRENKAPHLLNSYLPMSLMLVPSLNEKHGAGCPCLVFSWH